MKDFISNDDRLEQIQTYHEIADGFYYPTSRFTNSFVQRLGSSEIRVLTLHINSNAFRRSIQQVRQLLPIFAQAIFSFVNSINTLNREYLSISLHLHNRKLSSISWPMEISTPTLIAWFSFPYSALNKSTQMTGRHLLLKI